MEIWRTEINGNLKDMRGDLQELLVEVRQRPTRPEVEAMLATKVSVDVYTTEMKAMRDDIQDLRTKPEMMRNWLGTVIAAGGCAVTVLSIIVSTLVSIAAIIIQQHP